MFFQYFVLHHLNYTAILRDIFGIIARKNRESSGAIVAAICDITENIIRNFVCVKK